MVIILTTGFEVRGFKPDRGSLIFSELKNPECDFLWKDLWVPYHRFTACKKPQAKIRASEQNLLDFPCSM